MNIYDYLRVMNNYFAGTGHCFGCCILVFSTAVNDISNSNRLQYCYEFSVSKHCVFVRWLLSWPIQTVDATRRDEIKLLRVASAV